MSASLEYKADTKGIDDLLAKHPARKGDFMDALAEHVLALMKLSFGTSPPGKEYARGNGRVHVASQPGYPPNTDTGALINSLRWYRRKNDVRSIFGAEHGLYLEDSTELDRPFIGPAVREANKDVPKLGRQWLRIGE